MEKQMPLRGTTIHRFVPQFFEDVNQRSRHLAARGIGRPRRVARSTLVGRLHLSVGGFLDSLDGRANGKPTHL